MAVQGNNYSMGAVLSADGRYMAFESNASDLVPGDSNSAPDIFRFDRQTCEVERVSINSLEQQSTVGYASTEPSISANGRFIAFSSRALNLVAGETEGTDDYDIFVRDMEFGTTSLISASTTGTKGNSHSHNPVISADGTKVAFRSLASNLVANDTNSEADIFIRDGTTTERVSVATGGAQGESPFNNGVTNWRPAISADGRYVAFSSMMTNLVASDTNDAADVFLRDRQDGTTIRVSVSTAGGQGTGFSENPAISSDGRFIAFQSTAIDLVAGDTNNISDIFVRDTLLTATTRVSLANQGGQVFGGNANNAAISGDGRYVVFASTDSQFVLGDVGFREDIFIHDRTTAITRRVSTSEDGVQGDNDSRVPAISSDGMYVAFHSYAETLIPNDNNNDWEDVFVTRWQGVSAPPNVNLMRNGGFGSGVANWLTFATPDASFIVSQVTGGVFEFYRVPPPPGTGNQAVVFQGTTAQLLAGAPILIQFDIANSSSVRKRLSVLVHDGDFSDLFVCTLWLDPNAPMRTYSVRTHTTELWSNATVSFYAATAGQDGGVYRLDNVTFQYAPAQSTTDTDCVDPTVPLPPGGADSANLLTNGDFSAGMTAWGLFGQIVSQITAGVFEFYRSPGTPSGVVLQGSGDALVQDAIVALTFDLGNSSSVRKRVTVLGHDTDFSDLGACTFWLAPNTPLQTYVMRMYATEPWTNATVSVYPATVGADQWILLDNVSVQTTPGTAIVGTECEEPTGGLDASVQSSSGFSAVTTARGSGNSGSAAPDLQIARHEAAIDLRSSAANRLTFRSRLPRAAAPGLVQISRDGEAWETVALVSGSDDWEDVTVDLSDFAGQMIQIRFALRRSGDGSAPGGMPWQIDALRIEAPARR
jgi:Tol biopolymer transport system component